MRLDRLQTALVAAIAATCPVSIFAAQVLLSAALAVFGVRLAKGEAAIPRLPLDGPLLAFCVWTLLSASFSQNPVESYESSKKLVLFLLLYLAVEALREPLARERAVDAALLGGLALAAGSLLQYYFMGFDTLNNRPHSFLGHYMTASGVSMAALVLGATRLAWRSGPLARPTRDDLVRLAALAAALLALTALKRAELFPVEAERLFVAALVIAAAWMTLSRGPWPGPQTGLFLAALVVPFSAWALLVSRTRNAWLGAIAGLGVAVIRKAPRFLWLVPAGVAAILILRPPQILDRLTLSDASSRDRIYMWQAGLDMIHDKPVFGQGPGMVQVVYPAYRWPEAPNQMAPHLHDNFLQIAAERGVPGLVFWIWIVVIVLRDAVRVARGAPRDAVFGAASLAVLSAMLVAGAFEYNFGDSEVLMFTLLVWALPYAATPRAEPVA